MRKLLIISIVILLFSSMFLSVQAGSSPQVEIVPDTISPDGNVDICVTATTDNTVLADINPIKVQRRKIVIGPVVFVFGPLIEDYWLQISQFPPPGEAPWGPIRLPDVGDQIRIRFPDAAVEVTVDDDEDVEIGTGPYGWFWTDAEKPKSHPPPGSTPRDRLVGGNYLVWIGGTDGSGSFSQFYQFFVCGKRPQQ